MKLPPAKLARANILMRNGVVYISASSFNEMVTCPMRSYYSKVKRYYVPGEKIAALEFGITIHRIMEVYAHTGEVMDFQDLWRPYSDITMSYSKSEQNWDNLNNLGQRIVWEMVGTLDMMGYNGPYTYKKNGKVEQTIEVQAPYKVNDKLVLMRTIDLIGDCGGIPTVIDFKTSSRMYSVGLQDDISPQLSAYSLPHNLKGVPQPEQAMFLVGTKTKTPKAAAFPTVRSKARLKMFLDDLENVARMIRLGICYGNRDTIACGSSTNPRCDYRPLCYTGETKEVIELYEQNDTEYAPG